MIRMNVFLSLLIVFASCQSSKSENENMVIASETKIDSVEIHKDTLVAPKPKMRDLSREYKGIVALKSIDSTIQTDLKYASTDNFMGIVLYEDIDQVFIQQEVGVKLQKAQASLKKINPKLSLLVYDAVRPLSVQQKMWDALDSIPVSERTKFVSNPKNGSIHNYGAAVDLTICDENGVALDMGAGYDDIRKIAYPSLEQEFLKKGELTQQQIDNRKLLRKVMSLAGFYNISTEWWHFNSCTREIAKQKYELVR